jgi:hypothetical protein
MASHGAFLQLTVFGFHRPDRSAQRCFRAIAPARTRRFAAQTSFSGWPAPLPREQQRIRCLPSSPPANGGYAARERKQAAPPLVIILELDPSSSLPMIAWELIVDFFMKNSASSRGHGDLR